MVAFVAAPFVGTLAIAAIYLVVDGLLYSRWSLSAYWAALVLLVGLIPATFAAAAGSFVKLATISRWETEDRGSTYMYGSIAVLFASLPLVAAAAALPLQPDELVPALVLVTPPLTTGVVLLAGKSGRGPGSAIWTGTFRSLSRAIETAIRETRQTEERLNEATSAGSPHTIASPNWRLGAGLFLIGVAASSLGSRGFGQLSRLLRK